MPEKVSFTNERRPLNATLGKSSGCSDSESPAAKRRTLPPEQRLGPSPIMMMIRRLTVFPNCFHQQSCLRELKCPMMRYDGNFVRYAVHLAGVRMVLPPCLPLVCLGTSNSRLQVHRQIILWLNPPSARRGRLGGEGRGKREPTLWPSTPYRSSLGVQPPGVITVWAATRVLAPLLQPPSGSIFQLHLTAGI